jgi:hypothetical protein
MSLNLLTVLNVQRKEKKEKEKGKRKRKKRKSLPKKNKLSLLHKKHLLVPSIGVLQVWSLVTSL